MKVQVTVNNVRIIEPSILNENEYNIHNCEFEFTEEYNGLTKKAVFTNEANETYVETIVDDKCSIPTEVLKEKEHIKIGVYAYDVDNEELLLRYSPRPTEFYVHEGSYKEGENTTPPTPSEIEQLQAQITTNANNIEELTGDVVDINTELATINDDITNIKAEQLTQNEYIQANSNNIVDINGQIVDINQDIQDLEANKADKSEIPTKTSDLINDSDFVVDNNYVHTDNNFTDEDETQINQNASDIATLQSTKADKTEIPTKTSDLTNDSGFINKNVNDLVNYTLKTNTGSLIDLEINGTTYVITLSLKDVDGNVISTDTIDLPLESVVVGGSYDAVNKKIVLILENGNTVDIPVGDLIAGLQTEITSQNKLASDLVDDTNSGNKFVTTSEKQAWNAKYDKPVGGIPDTDLSSGVQTSLGKADTAIQEDDLTDYVKNTDYAAASKGGVVKSNNYYNAEISSSSGTIYCTTNTYTQYQGKENNAFISKGTLENVIAGKELVNKTYVDDIVGDIENILEELDIRKRGVVYEYKFKNNRNGTTHRQRL